jgi:endonuclease/exonuclease/phosphatase family metal-dependent hydrolase
VIRRSAWGLSVALATALLLQAVRVVFPLLYDVREEAGATTAIVWALAAFVAAPAALIVAGRALGEVSAWRCAAITLAATRIAMQFVHPIPLWLGALGVAVGLTTLALSLQRGRARGAGGATGIAVVAGMALDTTLFGAFETWDAVWQDGLAASVVGVGVPVLAVAAATATAQTGGREDPVDAWPMVVVGPFLLLHLLFLQSVSFATSETSVAIPGGIAFVLLGDLVGIVLAAMALRRERSTGLLVAGVLTVGAVAALALVQGTTVALVQPLGCAAAAAVFVAALASPVDGRSSSRARATAWFLLGTALFVGGAFAYQIDIDVPLPVPRATWPIAAAAVLALGAFRRHRPERVSVAPAVVPLGGVVVVPLLLLGLDTRSEPTTEAGTYRVLDWNIHTAVDGDGQIVLGEVYELIAAQDPDVVVLQEVGRGWPIAGQSDDLEWLARRLDMGYVWAPAADGQFGNAILSRLPIELDRVIQLPYGEGPQERSAVGATVGTDPGLFVVGVHLQHGDRPATRADQLDAVLDTWSGTPRWVLAGDLNMQPGDADLARLGAAELASAQDAVGDPDAPTAREPMRPGDRVDWIWFTPATLEVANFAIPRSEASDHLPLVVNVTPSRRS